MSVSGQKATMVTARTTSWRLDLLGPWLPALGFRFALRKDVWKSAAFSAHSLDMDCIGCYGFGSSGGSFLGFYLWVLGELKVEV